MSGRKKIEFKFEMFDPTNNPNILDAKISMKKQKEAEEHDALMSVAIKKMIGERFKKKKKKLEEDGFIKADETPKAAKKAIPDYLLEM
jgi:hypothetical protein